MKVSVAPLRKRLPSRHHLLTMGGALVFVVGLLLSLPTLIVWEQTSALHRLATEPFPVTVNPKEKAITENPAVDQQLQNHGFSLSAAGSFLGDIIGNLADTIVQTGWYSSLAQAGGVHFVTITPGFRKEQVARAFAKALGWNSEETQAFLADAGVSVLPVIEGTFSPGTYVVNENQTPEETNALIDDRFQTEILAHYGDTTQTAVPLADALTIASMIERETSDKDDMRMISGIIWNRLFQNMKLQIDATVQYAKASAKHGATGWWPIVAHQDLFLSSPYNTYQDKGLPPGPIANPSVAAVLAALNPKKTDCVFYFHDNDREFHCSATYEEHVALLKKYFGRGR